MAFIISLIRFNGTLSKLTVLTCGPIASKNFCFSCSEGVSFCFNSALSYALMALLGVENNKVPSTKFPVLSVSSPASAKTLLSLSSSVASSVGVVTPSRLSPCANMSSAVVALLAMASAKAASLSSPKSLVSALEPFGLALAFGLAFGLALAFFTKSCIGLVLSSAIFGLALPCFFVVNSF